MAKQKISFTVTPSDGIDNFWIAVSEVTSYCGLWSAIQGRAYQLSERSSTNPA
jgi:hypothetical protein